MDNDDQLIGRVLTRREVLRLLGTAGAAGAALLAGCAPDEQPATAAAGGSTAAAPTTASTDVLTAESDTSDLSTPTPVATAAVTEVPECVVRPALTEGPFFVDDRLNRSDIRPDPATGQISEGVPLRLRVVVSRLDETACTVFPGVMVDVWHCDALGVYSEVQGADPAAGGFLRGYQVTDAQGVAEFTTICPGWYPGRAVHIHFKLRTDPDAAAGTEFTSQWFFDEALTDEVHTREPYASRGTRTLRNEGDGIFRQAGDEMILELAPEGDGYAATFRVGIDAT